VNAKYPGSQGKQLLLLPNEPAPHVGDDVGMDVGNAECKSKIKISVYTGSSSGIVADRNGGPVV